MDPTVVPILSAVVGGVIGAAINQFVTHFRAKSDRAETSRTVQRDSAGALLGAAQDYAWELHSMRDENKDGRPRQATEVEMPESVELAHRRFQMELNRARMAVVEPEARAVVKALHRRFKAAYFETPSGNDLRDYLDWMARLEAMLYVHSRALLETGEVTLRPGGPAKPRHFQISRQKTEDKGDGKVPPTTWPARGI